VATLLLLPRSSSVADEPRARSGPLSPEEALQSFQLEGTDLRIELAAAEPQVIDPVAVRFDELGRMWVVEMRDYPNGPKPGELPLSKIKRLEDRDHDGRYETATTFAESLLFPTGLQPWKKGVIVTLAGRVAYFADDDGDGKADRTEDWYTGFAEENPQLRANHPTLALDNYIYVANGLRGGVVHDTRDPDSPPISISGRDFRFDPLTGKCEAVSGNGQFGLTFDDFGHRFVCTNRNPVIHVAIEDRYLKANPAVPIPLVQYDVAAAGENSRLFAISRTWTTSNLHANQFTAACGVLVFSSNGLSLWGYSPEAGFDLAKPVFICDPTANIVHKELIDRSGSTFSSYGNYRPLEFLASTDEWFRPVSLEVGPDGALYVVDMYRAVIEHPEWMPEELRNRADLRDGDDRGRIYRVCGARFQRYFAPFPGYSGSLVDELDSENRWRRDTAARLLLERQDDSVVRSLQKMTRSGKPHARVRALWLLKAYGKLKEEDLQDALSNDDRRVREQAIILAEPFINTNGPVRERVLQALKDKFPAVVLQAMLSLAPIQSDTEIDPLVEAFYAFHKQPFILQACLLASGSRIKPLATKILAARMDQIPDANLSSFREIFLAVGSANAKWDRELFEIVSSAAHVDHAAKSAFVGLLSAWDANQVNWRQQVKQDPPLQQRLNDALGDASTVALSNTSLDARKVAIELLRFGNSSSTLSELALSKSQDQQLRVLCVRSLAGMSDQNVWSQLFSSFPAESPPMRAAIVDAALASTQSTSWLLDELEAGRIRPQELGRTDVERLGQLTTPELQERAAKILEALTPEDRQKALARYRECLSLEGDAKHGRDVFSRSCANCHHVGDLGVDVAPDISDSRTKTLEQLLGDVVQPNRAIDGNYVSYIVQTQDGRSFTGVIASETATSVTLREAENKSTTLTRDEIEVIRSTGLSLMPEGLEQNLSLQDMADLLSFIKNWRYLDGAIPFGDRP
jgi:putative membrane-bound dehydrogenase-like protein